MSNFEKSFDDMVYEDKYYDKFNKDLVDEDNADGNSDEKTTTQEYLLLCEECDHQWEDTLPDDIDGKAFCPLCGSNNITQM